jgi:hypothetical protein
MCDFLMEEAWFNDILRQFEDRNWGKELIKYHPLLVR